MKKIIYLSSLLFGLLLLSASLANNTARPQLDIHTVGAYAMVPWPVSGTQVEKGSRYDRTKDLNFGFMCVWVRTDEAAEKIDLTELCQQIDTGWNANPPKAVFVRIDFWGNNGRERHEGPMSPIIAYKKRIDAVLQQLHPVIDKLQGISISEENILSNGRPAVLRDLYWHVKKQYPNLPVYQWWTPMTAVPGTYEGFFLPADGWIVDPYYHCKGYYGDAANIKRYVQKYLVTGLPLIFMPYATNFPKFFDPPINEWDVIEEQLQLCQDFNLPVAWFWTYSKTNQSGGTTYFGHPTGNPLMDKISQRVFDWTDYVKTIPADFDGNPNVAEIWDNPPLDVKIIPGDIILQESFTQSYFLDQSSGTGFRDLLWGGQTLAARGYKGRPVNVTLIYKLNADFPMQWPYVKLDALVKSSLKGQVNIALSCDQGQTWSHTANSVPNNDLQTITLQSRPDPKFKETKTLYLKIQLFGNAGSNENPPVRIDNLKIINMW